MRVLFLGDIGTTGGEPVAPSAILPRADLTIANLEGAIATETNAARLQTARHLSVYSTKQVLDVLRAFGVDAVSLANNHSHDLGDNAAAGTRAQLAQRGIAFFGAGRNAAEAHLPLSYCGHEMQLKVFGFGWPVIGCRPADGRSEGVNPLSATRMLSTIRALRRTDTSSFVVYYVHWNYELELFPQPAHRQLARLLVDEGVDAIIGLHPHVVQGVEFVGEKPIVYSLGNWFFPPRRIGRFSLDYPASVRRQLAVNLSVEGRSLKSVELHWCQFDPGAGTVTVEAVENRYGSLVQQLTPFGGMTHAEYVSWFKMHRLRRRGVTVYSNWSDRRANWARDRYMALRSGAIRAGVLLGLKRSVSGG